MVEAATELGDLDEGQRFATLVNSITDYAIIMLNGAGTIVSWNTGVERVHGYRAHEIIGQPYEIFFIDEDRRAGLPEKTLSEARAKGRSEVEGRRIRKDGGLIWVHAVIDAIKSPDGKVIGFANVTRDVTERKETERALVESERRFRLLVDGVVDYAIYMLDPSGIVTNWNAGAQRIKGYTAAEIVGQHFSRFYPAEERSAGLPARVLEIARREGRYESEGERVRKDGTRFWAAVVVDAVRDESGKLIGFAKVTRDITEKRRAQAALEQSEREFRLLVSEVTDYAIFMLDPNGIVATWNAGAEKIKGYKAQEIVGQHFSRFYPEQERIEGAPLTALTTALREGRFEAEGRRVRKDGSIFWANVVIDRVRDETGRHIGFAKITRDITERREAQILLQQAQERLAHSQKMDALGQLTGGVAHDFNNLLMIMGGQLRRLQKGITQQPEMLKNAAILADAIKRGEALTRQLLTFSRRQSLNPTAVDPAKALEQIKPMLSSVVGSTVRMVVTPMGNLWPIYVDQNEFEVALVNLVSNARDAALDGGGLVTITAENTYLHFDAAGNRVEGEHVCITVADTGAGIPADLLAKVIEPFFTTKQAGRGTGLGLSQVHGFAYQSGGSLVIRSEVGKGTQVSLYFPHSKTASAPQASTFLQEKVQLTGEALVVDDNPDIRRVACDMLMELGFTVIEAGDAEQALKQLATRKVDLVLSDIVMSGDMNGVQMAREMREEFPNLPIILASGYSEFSDEARREFAFLRKPYRIEDLTSVINATVEREKPPANLIPFPNRRDT